MSASEIPDRTGRSAVEGPWGGPDLRPHTGARPTAVDGATGQYPCPQCGADLAYNPAALALTCAHCGYQRDVGAVAVDPLSAAPATLADTPAERDYLDAVSGAAARHDAVSAREAQCDSCGARVGLEAGVEADVCPFCTGALTLDPDPRRRFAPDGVLPFAISEDQARAALAEWLERLWFAPGDLGAHAREGRRLKGVYLPFWTFDADAQADYRGQRGDAYTVYQTKTVFVDGKAKRKRVPVRKIRWTWVSGRVRKAFDDVLVAASRSLPQQFATRLSGLRGGWDLQGLRPYRGDFLAGYRAEGYTVDLTDGFAEAKGLMEGALRRAARFDIGGDEQRIARLDAAYRDVTFKLALLPIWIAAYRYRERTFRFVVNGRTGEVIGERPYSWWKVALTGAGAATALVLLALGAIALDTLD